MVTESTGSNDHPSSSSSSSSTTANRVQCRLVHHGAAAAMSGNQAITWLRLPAAVPLNPEEPTSTSESDSDTVRVVYASHANLNLATPNTGIKLNNEAEQAIVHVERTLRCSVLEQLLPSTTPIPVITCVTSVQHSGAPTGISSTRTTDSPTAVLVSGFSNGMIQIWLRSMTTSSKREEWIERTLETADSNRSVTTIGAAVLSIGQADVGDIVWIAAGTSAGAVLYRCRIAPDATVVETLSRQNLCTGAVSTVLFTSLPNHGQQHPTQESNSMGLSILFVGTAAPRHNKIHVYHLATGERPNTNETTSSAKYSGFLIGHEDWITSLAFKSSLLASGSQDTRIRLWKLRTSETTSLPIETSKRADSVERSEPLSDDSDDNDDQDNEEGEESRLEIVHENRNMTTSASLEALLYGHEESVTSVTWHPDSVPVYGVDSLLLSSSMDRTVLFWSESAADGIWTPLTRVGSAGGILGGSMGSTLLGFCSVAIEPIHGRSLIGHAYGGTLHMWDLQLPNHDQCPNFNTLASEERATLATWKASPSVTGHFDGVTDLCWEAAHGEYLLTVSIDQTCRLWSPVATATEPGKILWVELARPQVHGYDLTAVASLSSASHPHLIVTAADEKELRAFDAPRSTLRTLHAVSGYVAGDDPVALDRVERAFIPSLGLSNKASASDAAAEDEEGMKRGSETIPMERLRLPLERDLGAVSLWPEVQKLFGHTTEIYALASTVGARTSYEAGDEKIEAIAALLASSAKSRDVEDAKIRLWNVTEGKCMQVLAGGHKSTVATLCFSANGRFLASSGKDRRLCLWQSDSNVPPTFSLAVAKDLAHKRIIWSVAFCPLNSNMLATGSRDGCVKIWQLGVSSPTEPGVTLAMLYDFEPIFQRNDKPDAVTALAFAPVACSNGYVLLAVGLESGRVELWEVPLSMSGEQNDRPRPLTDDLDSTQCHSARISKLAWRPIRAPHVSLLHLASCSMDHGCRIWEIVIAL